MSAISQVIGALAPSILNTSTTATNSVAKDVQQAPTPGQIQQISKAASERTTTSSKVEDKERAPQTPKRVEGLFTKGVVKPKAGRDAPVEQQLEEKTPGENVKLDIVA